MFLHVLRELTLHCCSSFFPKLLVSSELVLHLRELVLPCSGFKSRVGEADGCCIRFLTRLLPAWTVLHQLIFHLIARRSTFQKEVEVLILRHQLNSRKRCSWVGF